MSDLWGRAYQVAKAALDGAKERLDDVDERAQAELARALDHADFPQSSDDPMERAQAKISAARQGLSARTEARPAAAATQPSNPMQTAYKILGIPAGSDWLAVQQAANKLRERCAPSRFPNGSEEQVDAQNILQRVEEAYQVLQNALDPNAGRFNKLEI